MDDNVRPIRPGPEELVDDRYLLDTFLEHTPDSVYFKDEMSRFIRMSRALADRLWTSRPKRSGRPTSTSSRPSTCVRRSPTSSG
jgi:hypothetical protein